MFDSFCQWDLIPSKGSSYQQFLVTPICSAPDLEPHR
jgi:hypothetical protein